jgi:hypothetical protein
MEYFEAGGGAAARLSLIPVSVEANIPPDQWRGEYFPNESLAGQPAVVRGDAAVDFDWGLGGPAAGFPVDNFSVRWSRTLPLGAGTYRFTTSSDDGLRLFVDGQLTIDRWDQQGSRGAEYEVDLTAGDHAILLEYREGGGAANVQLQWLLVDNQSDPPAGTWRGEYYTNQNLTGTPAIVRGDPVVDFEWGLGSPVSGFPSNHFSVRWSRAVTLDAGTYRFSTSTDDGVRLSVDGQLLIDKWISQGLTTYDSDIELTAGDHTVVMEYFEEGGGAVARLDYALLEQASGGRLPPGFQESIVFDDLQLPTPLRF